jgi:hypothetical protein
VGVGVGVPAVAVGVAVGVADGITVGVGVDVGVGVAVGVAVGVGVGVPHGTPTFDISTVFMSWVVPLNPHTIRRRFPIAAPFVQECGTFIFGPVDQVLLAMS